MSNTPTRRDARGRKIRRQPHRLSMRAAAARRAFKARQAQIAADIAARAAAEPDAPTSPRRAGKTAKQESETPA